MSTGFLSECSRNNNFRNPDIAIALNIQTEIINSFSKNKIYHFKSYNGVILWNFLWCLQ